MNYYAYRLIDGTSGVVNTWAECRYHVYKVSGAIFKKLTSMEEATEWLNTNEKAICSPEEENAISVLQDAIYCDSGTGRGQGVEVRVTNRDGVPYNLRLTGWGHRVNEFDNILFGPEFTNNYGELAGLCVAIVFARWTGTNKIFTDSRLVLDYWSRGICKSKNRPTQILSEAATIMRTKFEADGGMIGYISGDYNPADLGFHQSKH